jgi:hypothetical protein
MRGSRKRLGAIIYCRGKSKTDWLGKAGAGKDVSQVGSHLAHGRCIVSSSAYNLGKWARRVGA